MEALRGLTIKVKYDLVNTLTHMPSLYFYVIQIKLKSIYLFFILNPPKKFKMHGEHVIFVYIFVCVRVLFCVTIVTRMVGRFSVYRVNSEKMGIP